jgi:hypothetical protein
MGWSALPIVCRLMLLRCGIVIRSVRRLVYIFTGLTALLHGSLVAMAAFTPISDSPDQFDEPNLIGVNPFPGNLHPSALETLYGEVNLRRIHDGADIAFRHRGVAATVTPVAHFSTLTSSLWLLPNRVKPPQFPFPPAHHLVAFAGSSSTGFYPSISSGGSIALADSGPVFGLRQGLSDNSRGNSDPSLNNPVFDWLVTFEIIGNVGRPDNAIGNLVLAWEDSGLDDDYQDLIVEISGVTAVPEPSGLWLAGTALLCVHRLKQCSAEP